jgi:Tfp pilus assembly protein PilO
MNNKIVIGSIISFLFLFGMVNAQSITVPSNIYANSTFPITISGLSSPNNTIGMIMIDVAGNSYPVVYTNTTANAFGFINSTGNYSITASEFVNNSTSQIASINISVLANPSDMLQASLSNLSNSTNDSLLSVNSAITNVSDNVSILNTSIASINGTVQSSLSVMQSNINGVDANVSSIASELQNNATAISQENNLIVSYMNNTNTELSQVGVDLSNINTSMTNTNNLQGEYNILFVVVDIVIITVFSYMFWKSGKNKSKEETTIEKEILKQVKKEKEKEISEVIKAKENATKFNVLKKGKKEIENEMLKKQFANDTELKRLRDEYLNVKASASKNNIPEEALPEFIAYKNYMKKTYKISINKDEDIVS